MNKNAWFATVAFGLVMALPSAASAHGQYLEAVSDAAEAEYGVPACVLPGMTCGLCHEPSEGERLVDIVVDFEGIESTIRNGPFYDSLTGPGGWDHMPHMNDGNAHRNANLDDLMMNVLPAMIAGNIDSDMDGVPDLEELSLGYNPLLEYEEADPARSQLCKQAGDFPDLGGTGSTGVGESSSGGESTAGEEESSSGGGEGTTTSGGSTAGTNTNSGTATTTGMMTAGTTGDSTGSTGAGDDGGGGCRIGGSGYDSKILGLLLVLGLVGRRRRD